jgi:anti-repressor protein
LYQQSKIETTSIFQLSSGSWIFYCKNPERRRMNDLETTKMQTPIEIALGIDENGMTTAKKLYEFLEMDSRNYSRWCKSNITENEFAEENVDYWAFVINEEWGGQATTDYKLTAHFAKKLSMKGNGAKAEEARDYFTTLEERVKQKVIDLNQLSPELQMFQKIFNSVAEQQLEQKRQAEQLNHVEQRVESIREVVALDTTSWRDDTGNILRKISMELGGGQAYSQVRAESYELLSKRMGVNLKQRLTNKRRRMADEGICKSTRDKLSYVDIIAEDKKLIEGYTAIVKEMAIRYGVGKD